MGTTLLSALVTRVRTDLKDLDGTNYLWTDDELKRHIAHAVNDYQKILPYVQDVMISAVADSSGRTRRQSVGSPLPDGYLWTERVEYPIDNEPPGYLPFSEDPPGQGSLFFVVGEPPAAGESIKVWYASERTLSDTVSTIPTEHEEIIGLGAVAYAADAASRYSAGRLNASAWAPRGLAHFAEEKMFAYLSVLNRLRASYASAGLNRPAWKLSDEQ